MRCVSPVSVPRPNGKGSKDRVAVPCGKCVNCLTNKRTEWSFRIMQELRFSSSAFFVTMTYDDNHSPANMSLNKREVQLFLKRLRSLVLEHGQYIGVPKNVSKGQNPGVRYYLVGEYGSETKRPHYHGLFFNLPDNADGLVNEAWGKGFVSLGTVTVGSVYYVTKYVINRFEEFGEKERPFALMSSRPGIGSKYLEVNYQYHKKGQRFHATVENGVKVNLPRYYKDRIFNISEKTQHEFDMQEIADKKIINDMNRLQGLGENYFESEMIRVKQRLDNVKNKLNKKGQL